jgi:hypothetical protein
MPIYSPRTLLRRLLRVFHRVMPSWVASSKPHFIHAHDITNSLCSHSEYPNLEYIGCKIGTPSALMNQKLLWLSVINEDGRPFSSSLTFCSLLPRTIHPGEVDYLPTLSVLGTEFVDP